MSQKKETIMIGTREVTVSEVSVTRIYRMLTGEGDASIINVPLPQAMEKVRDMIPLAIDIDMAELLQEELFSDDLERLYEAFKRTNPTFFVIARTFNLEKVLAQVVGSVLTGFSQKFSSSLPPGMGLPSGTTDTDISLTA